MQATAVARTADIPEAADDYHEPMRPALAQFRRRTLGGFPAPDVVLTVLLCAIAVASVLTGNPDEGPVAITLPAAVLMTGALLWRRRTPIVAVLLVALASLAQTLLARTPGSLWSLAVFVIVMYSVAAWSTEAVAAIAGAGFVAVLLAEERWSNGVDFVFILLLFGGTWLLGRGSSVWRARITAAERRQQEAARLAAVEERLRIARDLHDVVAHSLGAIAVQADAAEAALHVDPGRAVEPVRSIRATAREALGDIRRVLDALRADDPSDAQALPGVSAVGGLVALACATGTPAVLDLRVEAEAVPPAIDNAAYRIVQEALSNVRAHASGAATAVELVGDVRTLTVRVVNDGSGAKDERPARPGYGLRGMSERVHALGGTFFAGATGDGGFELSAVFPLASRADAKEAT